MAKPLGICEEGACQILAVGNALGLELWVFLDVISNLIFRILDILKYMVVYEGIWTLSKVYESI